MQFRSSIFSFPSCLILLAILTSPVFTELYSYVHNDRPIVGILTLNNPTTIGKEQFATHIPASYVKFVEGGGAQVIPIWIDKPRDYYKDIMGKING